MKAELKDYYSADVEDLSNWKPKSSEEIYLGVEFEIGPEHTDSSDVFQLTIASPEAIRKRENQKKLWPGRHMLIVCNYDWNGVLSYVKEILSQTKGSTWKEIVEYIGRHLAWEYEDHDYE